MGDVTRHVFSGSAKGSKTAGDSDLSHHQPITFSRAETKGREIASDSIMDKTAEGGNVEITAGSTVPTLASRPTGERQIPEPAAMFLRATRASFRALDILATARVAARRRSPGTRFATAFSRSRAILVING